MKLVFADFDQTISSFDTLLPFAHFLLQQEGRLYRYPLVFCFYALYRTGLLSDRSFRTRLCRFLVAGRTTRQVAEIAEQFHTYCSSTIINPVVWNWIKEQTSCNPCGIAHINEIGAQVDFHALRHTWCTIMQRYGVAPRVAQQMMRRSDAKLTEKGYSDVNLLPPCF